MIDNWTLQEVKDLLANGLPTRRVGEIVLSPDLRRHSFSPIPEAVVQIDALLTLLTNLVCFDELIVDSEFVHTWQRSSNRLLPLLNCGIIFPKDHSPLEDNLANLREKIVDELCVTPTLRKSMAAIRSAWLESNEQVDPHLSALIWGGAGMLARSHLAGVPYFGHPFRRKLLAQTKLYRTRESAAHSVTKFLETERAKMFRFRSQGLTGSFATVAIPPLAARVIEESSDLEQLVPAAINLRDQNVELREWIAKYQAAIDEEDERRQMKHERILRDLSKALQSKYGLEKSGSTGISISSAFFRFDISRSIVDTVKHSFGVRSTLFRLAMAPRGVKALEKLVRMLGEGQSSLGRDTMSALQSRYSLGADTGA